MSKIILGYEKLYINTLLGWNYNGRIEPSNIVATEDRLQTMNDYESYHYNLLIEPQYNRVQPDLPILHAGFNNSIEPKLISDITDEQYFYIIELRNIHLYLDFTSHIAISDKALTDIRNRQAHLVFIYHHEGDMGKYIHTFNMLVQELNLPKDRVLLLHGDFDTVYYNDAPYTYVPVNCFPFWLKQFARDTIVDYTPNKLYVSYNRIARPHRIVLLYLLYKNNLIDSGIVSCGILNTEIVDNIISYNFNATDTEFFSRLSGMSPDDKQLGVDNPAQDIVAEHYTNTFVSLVSETLTEGLFFSEKIYKPVAMGQPFILVGSYKQLEFFRSFGFMTFDKWWNEDYDNIEDTVQRIECIVQLLTDLNNKPVEELMQIREEMKPVLIHNQQVFNQMITNKPYQDQQPIVDYLKTLI